MFLQYIKVKKDTIWSGEGGERKNKFTQRPAVEGWAEWALVFGLLVCQRGDVPEEPREFA